MYKIVLITSSALVLVTKILLIKGNFKFLPNGNNNSTPCGLNISITIWDNTPMHKYGFISAVSKANNKLCVNPLCFTNKLTNFTFFPKVELALSISGNKEPTQTRTVAGALHEHRVAKTTPAAKWVDFVTEHHQLLKLFLLKMMFLELLHLKKRQFQVHLEELYYLLKHTGTSRGQGFDNIH